MNDNDYKRLEAQAHIDGLEIAAAALSFASEFRDIYPTHILQSFVAVGPTQSFVGHLLKLRAEKLADNDTALAQLKDSNQDLTDWYDDWDESLDTLASRLAEFNVPFAAVSVEIGNVISDVKDCYGD